MALTQTEKLAGRVFRAEQERVLTESFEADPPTYTALFVLSHYRHECLGRRNISTAIALKEVYVLSPAYLVSAAGVVREGVEAEPGEDPVPAGRFGFIYKSGRCKARLCGHTARSKEGHVVDAYERVPLAGRVARK